MVAQLNSYVDYKLCTVHVHGTEQSENNMPKKQDAANGANKQHTDSKMKMTFWSRAHMRSQKI